jgi:signal transduction histidine kinase/CheY-like chemotaxis protein
LRFGIPVLASLLAGLLTVGLQPMVAPGRFLLFLAAVVVSAWCGGFPSGLVATVVGALGHVYLLLPTAGKPSAADPSCWYGLIVFIPVALLVSGLIGALHAAHQEAQLLMKALRERVLELVEADRRKDGFLAMLRHELRNPLGTAGHALQVLRLRDDYSTVLWARTVAERQFNLLSRLVDDLLDSSRLVRGELLLHRDRIDLVRLVRDTLTDYVAGLEEAGMTLCQEIPEGPIWVDADRLRLTQVLGNLLHNAIKFTDPGGMVTVRLAADTDRRRVVVSIVDTGIGFDQAVLPRVFSSYAQPERSLGHRRGGLGLGLALVKALVELHGGDVEAASAGPGCGAELSFRLPLASEPPGSEPVPPAAAGAEPAPLYVLIVEDNRDAADSLRMLLGLSGHDVAVAHSGPAGVVLARQLRPDVVLCDLGLPGMNGFAVARTLRREAATAHARLVALTGYTGEEAERRSREAGFDHVLAKPVKWSDLERLLADVPGGVPVQAEAVGRR